MAALGDVLGGRYRLVELLGQGGMATIYRATDGQLGREVAVKVLRSRLRPRPDFVARFKQEAQSGRLSQPPQHRRRLRLSAPTRTSLHRHGARRRGGRGNAPCPQRAAPTTPGGSPRSRGCPRSHRGPRPRDRPPRREAWQHPRLDRRPGEGHGLRHRSRLGRRAPDAARRHARLRPLLQPRAGARRAGDRGVRHLQPRGVLYELLTGRRPWEGDSAASVAMARIAAPRPRLGRPTQRRRPSRRSIGGLEPGAGRPFASARARPTPSRPSSPTAPAAAAPASWGPAGRRRPVRGAGRATPAAPPPVRVAAASAAPAAPYPPDAYAGPPTARAHRPAPSRYVAPPPPERRTSRTAGAARAAGSGWQASSAS